MVFISPDLKFIFKSSHFYLKIAKMAENYWNFLSTDQRVIRRWLIHIRMWNDDQRALKIHLQTEPFLGKMVDMAKSWELWYHFIKLYSARRYSQRMFPSCPWFSERLHPSLTEHLTFCPFWMPLNDQKYQVEKSIPRYLCQNEDNYISDNKWFLPPESSK